VRALAQALHDHIELQQLRTAAAQAAGPAATIAAPAGAEPLASQQVAPPPAQQSQPLFLTLPLAIGGQYATLELHVQPDRNARRAPGEPAARSVRATFSVQLERLGTVGADIRLAGTSMRCRLNATSPDTVDALTAASAGLRARLETAGFEIEALACERSPEPPNHPRAASLHHVSLNA
jgi:hypothetical protein